MVGNLEALTERFAENGFAVARGLFTPEEAAEIREAFMKQAENGPGGASFGRPS